MRTIRISGEADIAAPADRVYRILSDYRNHHPSILPPAFSDFTVEQGGVGAGTVFSYTLTLLGRPQRTRQRVEEPDPGRVLVERDLEEDLETTFTVTSTSDGSTVRIETVWAVGGPRGLVLRLLMPRLLGPIYRDELARLDRYARERTDA
jgi:hypothetical protein